MHSSLRGIASVAMLSIVAAPAFGQGACCLFDASCVPAADAAECSSSGGVFLPGEDCADDPCGVGACCRDTVCVEADAYACITGGRDFAGAGTACEDDPCAIGQGACCFKDGSCQELSESDCTGQGGTFLGPGTTCALGGCALGGCCLVTGCEDLAKHQCDALGGEHFPGEACAADPCPPNDCPAGTLFGQQRDEPDDFVAGTSDEDAGFKRFEDFSGVAGPIEGILFYGLDLDHVGGNEFEECVEPNPLFNISFHEDAGGRPGALVCSYKATATRTPTGIFYLGAELNEYSVAFANPCALVEGWVAIEGFGGDPQCWFLWMSAGSGGSWCEGCGTGPQDMDLALCLLGTPGGVFGACCDDATGGCADGAEISECTAPGLRFAPDTLCDDLDPPCGVVVGACCFEEGECAIEQEEACLAAGGAWLGDGTLCVHCPCAVGCPEGGIAEGEADCFDGYVDDFNGGCDASPPAYSPIAIGDTVCGTSGIYDDGDGGDFDWYQVTVDEATELFWTVRAEFQPRLWIIDGTEGCPGTILTTAATLECNELTLWWPVGPGTYWLVVVPNVFADSSACGGAYAATLSAPCPPDLDGDGNVGTSDLLTLLSAWGPNPGHPADIDGDGHVGTADLLALLADWGPCF